MIYKIKDYKFVKKGVSIDKVFFPFSEDMLFLKNKTLILTSDLDINRKTITQKQVDILLLSNVDKPTEKQVMQKEINDLTIVISDLLKGDDSSVEKSKILSKGTELKVKREKSIDK